eukprot:gene14031-94_t
MQAAAAAQGNPFAPALDCYGFQGQPTPFNANVAQLVALSSSSCSPAGHQHVAAATTTRRQAADKQLEQDAVQVGKLSSFGRRHEPVQPDPNTAAGGRPLPPRTDADLQQQASSSAVDFDASAVLKKLLKRGATGLRAAAGEMDSIMSGQS